ncbi:MAG: TIGR03960 family B12-binding radical SAM protein [Planctomycetes bacterium]|nr:TIGR03960 family B12-binding radical SAM protein [Planctomycetota bacterium]
MSLLPQIEKHLLRVRTPAQYMGGEVNSIVRDWDKRVRFALCFPDTYAIGMSNQGFRILYHLLNERYEDLVCERAFAPWGDMEKVLRDNALPLYSLENYRALREFDSVGFSLQNETSYTNLLNMLDLGGISLRSDERLHNEPVVIAGGTGAVTPEPLAEFVDCFLLGEGEEALPAFLHLLGVWRGRLDSSVLDQYRPDAAFSKKDVHAAEKFTLDFRWIDGDTKTGTVPRAFGAGTVPTRQEFLLLCARAIPGCYVPSMYEVLYHENGTLAAITPKFEGVPPRVKKNSLSNLNTAFYPTRQILPYCEVVQDRVTIEVMRGCTEGCRYCQAGMIDRPQRYRTPETVLRLARELVQNTGYDEISLLSLSSSDHPQLLRMIDDLQKEFAGKHVSVALPSLRINDQLEKLPSITKNVRKGGLTMAPETGSERLRRVINKMITQQDLVNGAKAAIENGYTTIKFYMMLGLPTENEHDIHESAMLLNNIAQMARAMGRKNMDINVTVSIFVPKSFTPFQWEPMCDRATIEKHAALLRSLIKHKSIRLRIGDYPTSWLEAVFSRGDRRLSRVVELAWRAGARFDAWDEKCRLDLWHEAMKQAGLSADFYIHRERARDEVLPWDMISVGTNKRTLWDERVRSRLEEYTKDCSGHTPGCIACGVDPLTCRTGIDAPEDEMSADMERRKSVRYAPEFRARLSQRETLDEVAQRAFR